MIPTTRIKFIILLSICLVWIIEFTGCIPSVSVEKKYFQIYLPRSPQAVDVKKNQSISDKTILVNSIEVEKIYNDYRVVYRISPYQLNYYFYNYWIKKPELLVKEAIVEYLSSANLFKEVITGYSQENPDFQLKAKVYMLEESDSSQSWYAHLKMDIEIEDFKSKKQLVVHSFDRKKQMIQKKVERLPVLISRILKEELDIAIEKLNTNFTR